MRQARTHHSPATLRRVSHTPRFCRHHRGNAARTCAVLYRCRRKSSVFLRLHPPHPSSTLTCPSLCARSPVPGYLPAHHVVTRVGNGVDAASPVNGSCIASQASSSRKSIRERRGAPSALLLSTHSPSPSRGYHAGNIGPLRTATATPTPFPMYSPITCLTAPILLKTSQVDR